MVRHLLPWPLMRVIWHRVPPRLQAARDRLVAITHRVAALQEVPPPDHEAAVRDPPSPTRTMGCTEELPARPLL
eukprot:514216-Prymnesium_polylepis.2